jgi:hypothetical protein
MSKSTRQTGRGAGRAGFEYFDRRQMGPWVPLRPLFRGRGLLATLLVAVVVTILASLNPYVVGGLLVVLFLASFAITWQIIGLLVRARAVLFVAVVVFVGNQWFQSLFGDLTGSVLFLALVAGLLLFPPTGRFLISRFWCVLDRQRIRACLKACKIRTMNLDGSLPFLLWARPTKTGERVWVWVRAGAAGADIEDALTYIAPSCYARDARIHRVRKIATLVAVEVIRRDPLSTGESVSSPLARLSSLVSTVKGEGTEAIRTATVEDITTTEPASETRTNGRKPGSGSSAGSKSTEPAESSVMVGGEDVTDWV